MNIVPVLVESYLPFSIGHWFNAVTLLNAMQFLFILVCNCCGKDWLFKHTVTNERIQHMAAAAELPIVCMEIKVHNEET